MLEKRSNIRKYGWLLVPLVAFGGLFYPILGLLVIAVMIGLMVTGLMRGKYWCGNICPHGSLFDLILKKISFNRQIPDFFKSSLLKWSFFVLFMGMFVLRIIRALGSLGTEEFTTTLGMTFVLQYLIMPTILGISLAVLINPRTWCSFCPMGTLTQLLYQAGQKFGLNSKNHYVTISDIDKCEECGLCARACPLDLEPYKNFDQNNQFTDPDCIQCGACVEECPLELLNIPSKN